MSFTPIDLDIGKCHRDKLDSYQNYNTTVEVVSSIEAFFKLKCKQKIQYFDRFPVLGQNRLTPDFTVMFNEKYGLIGEISRSLPENETGFKKELKQLEKYDQPLAIKKSDDEKLVPEDHNIVLILGVNASSQIVSRIKDKIESREISFNHNLVFLKYVSQLTERVPKYIIRKFPGYNKPFTDPTPNKERNLEVNLDPRHEPIIIRVEDFQLFKTMGVFCNDCPPDIYMSVYLWMNVFYKYLTPDEIKIWRDGNDRKGIPKEFEISSLVQDLNTKYIPRANIEDDWIKKAFVFLENAGLAEKLEENIDRVDYRNLTAKVANRTYFLEGERKRDEISELSKMLVDRYCKRVVSEATTKKLEAESEKKQVQLKNFL